MIELKRIKKNFGCIPVLDHVDMTLQSGATLALKGTSGAGKTTLLRVIAGLETVQEGEVWIDGNLVTNQDICIHPSERKLSFVFQFPVLWPHMTIEENVAYGLSKHRSEIERARLEKCLKDFGIHKHRRKKPQELSGGEKKRVSLARALLMKRPYILMDEPLVHLDNALKKELIQVIKENLKINNAALLYVTHDHETLEMFKFSAVRKLCEGRLKE